MLGRILMASALIFSGAQAMATFVDPMMFLHPLEENSTMNKG